MDLDELRKRLAAGDEAGWDWGDYGFLAVQIDALLAVVEAAQEHEHTASAFGEIQLPVPGCPICKALAGLTQPKKGNAE